LLITTAAVGSGHVSAATAVAQAAASRGLEVRVVDALDHVPAAVRAGLPRAFVGLMRHAPGLVEQVGQRLDVRREPDDHGEVRRRLARAVGASLVRTVASWRPGAVIHTHYFGLHMLDPLGRFAPPVHAVTITDHGLHGLWLHPAVRRYYVSHAALAERIASLGIPEDRLRSSGIPVDPRFAALPTRAEARARLGIEPGGPLILLIAAGLAPASAEAIVRGLASGFGPLEVAVATGRSVELAGRLPRLADAHTPVRFHWLGHTRAMPDWMAAADLVVGKPGGLTSSEALAAGRPFVVVDPYPLQEVANARYLVSLGAGVRAADPSAAVGLALDLVQDDRRRGAMAAAARAAGRPAAAAALVDDLLAAVWQPQPPAAPVAA